MKAKELFESVTNKIIKDMEAGELPWDKPWHSTGNPMNALTKKQYSGGNALILWLVGSKFEVNQWLTYKQAQELGGNVKAGSKGTPIIFYLSASKEVENKNGESELKLYKFAKTYTVFNVSQCDGIEIEKPKPLEFTPIDAAENIVNGMAPSVSFGGDRAFYMPSNDAIQMPNKESFKSVDAYYTTLMHELVHWTGAKSRLDRKLSGRFGTEDYAFEELVAELGAAFLCASIGMQYTTQHASYIQSWIKALKNDSRMIFKAASQAQAAVNYIMNQNQKEKAA